MNIPNISAISLNNSYITMHSYFFSELEYSFQLMQCIWNDTMRYNLIKFNIISFSFVRKNFLHQLSWYIYLFIYLKLNFEKWIVKEIHINKYIFIIFIYLFFRNKYILDNNWTKNLVIVNVYNFQTFPYVPFYFILSTFFKLSMCYQWKYVYSNPIDK